jgi:hypothetical protein
VIGMTSFVRSGSEFVVNTTQPRAQIQSDGARLSNGNFVVTWADRDYGTSVGAYLKGQIYLPDGTAVGGELSLGTANSGVNHPAIAALANGGFVVAWNGIPAQVQMFDASGLAISNAVTLSGGVASSADIVGLANGGFAVTWNGSDISGDGVRVSTFDQNGVVLVNGAGVNTATVGNQADPSITALANGGYVITWTDRGSAAWPIKAQIYDAAGMKSGSEFVVTPAGFSHSVESSVTALSNGNFAVAWSGGPSGTGSALTIQIYTIQGVAVGSPITMPKGEGGNQTGPVITALSDGGFVLGWLGNTGSQSDGSGSGIFIQAFDANAQATGGIQSVNDQVHGDQKDISIVALAGGGFVVNWTDYNGFGADNDSVRAQIFMPDTNPPATDVMIISGGGGATATITALENNTAVAFVRATPAASSVSVQFSITGGADAGLFAIDANSGLLRFVSAPDFEAPSDLNTDNTYEVVVTASDGILSDSQTINVIIPDGNDAPAMNGVSTFVVQENSLSVGTVSAVDPENNPVIYTLGGADGARFSIVASTGAITFNTAPNFEVPLDQGGNNVYDITVSATDANGAVSAAQVVSVTVTNVNEGTVISSNGGGATAAITVDENQTGAITVVARDNIGATLTYSIAGGYDAAKFSIDAATGVMTFVSAPNFESPNDFGMNRVYDVTVAATDGLQTDTQALAITIRNVNEAPIMIGGATRSYSVNEGSYPFVTYVDATDPENNTRTYSIAGGADAALFTINPSTGSLSFAASPDFEAPADADANNIYDIIVQVSDGNLASTQAIAVTVLNQNEAPFFTSQSAVSVQENGTAVTTVSALDPENQTVVYSITGGADASRFSINSATGELNFASAPNYEAPNDIGTNNVYNITLSASDGTLSRTQNLAITVTNQFEGPTAITTNGGGATAAFSVKENQSVATTVVVDNLVIYSITGGADAGMFTIDANSGVLSFLTTSNYEAPDDADFNRVYDVTVAATDGVITDTQVLAITITNVNEAPTITSNGGGATAAVSMVENTSLVISVQATDPDTTALVYSILGGADANRFTINSSTGALSFISPPDFEAPTDVDYNNIYDVNVRVTDGTSIDTQAVTVTVLNGNDAPVFTSSGPFLTPENTTVIGTVAATDLENDVITYSLVPGGSADLMTINSATGELSFLTPQDFETQPSGFFPGYYVTIAASDGASTTFENIRVQVLDVNEVPFITSNGGGAASAISVNENTTAVTTVMASDPENAPRTYSIAGGADASAFAINATTGVLSFVSARNFEAPTNVGANGVYEVTVAASDGTNIDTQDLSITVQNVNEGVSMTSGVTFSVAENQTAVSTLTAIDLDGTSPTFSIAGGPDAARFSIDAITGALRFVTAPNYEAPNDVGANRVYNVNVRATDGILSDVKSLAITVTNVNEPVVITSNGGGDTASRSIAENTRLVTTVTSVDPENAARSYAIAGGADAALFTINASTGALNFITAPNFEAPTDSDGNNIYSVVVSASAGGNTDTQALTVTVTNVNEGVSITSSAAVSMSEGASYVQNVTAEDVDGDTLVYSIAGGADAAQFVINAATGALSFLNAPDFEAPTDFGSDNIYDVTLNASDGTLMASQNLAVTVANGNDAPVLITPLADQLGAEYTAITFAVPVGTFSDFDSAALAYTATLASGIELPGWLTFDSAYQTFSGTPPQNYTGNIDVRVTASDGSLSLSDVFVLQIAPVNDGLINGSGSADTMVGDATQAFYDGQGGDDYLDGGAGADTLLGGEGNDRLVYDAADIAVNGGVGSDTLVIVDGSLPTGFNLVASSFEQAEWQQTDMAGQSWSTSIGRYNSNWQITSSSTTLDNGLDREMLYDYTASTSWKTRQLDYAAPAEGGALTYDYFIFDDLSSRDTSFDADLATAYKSIRNDYDAAGQRTYLYFVFEDTSGRDTTLDYTADILWQSQRNDYDATGFKTYNYYVFDDGTSRDTSLDNTAAISWQSLRQDYDVNGAMNYQYFVFDDDTSRQVVIDVANQFSWTTQVTNYSATGQAVEFFVT